ncbi:MauE/DoxX family redox-associated membrane protein [Mucilaginibacter sp. PAMB04274]|uniref:MauE/DoxX family redox-associated membrane protein n=1 Tax=Mucilaginibacter sp. PAMB04274 TaxID=3138568 RepID=UPI00332D38E1
MKFGDFHDQMQLQVLPESMKLPLIYVLPPFEIILALLLLSERKYAKGLYISITLLTAFTTYIALAIFGGLGHIPCSCGGVLEKLSWKEHLIFNLFFIVINLTTIRLLLIERRFSGEVT